MKFYQVVAVVPLYSDVELVSRMVEGDVAAFDLIYRKHWKICYNEAFRRLDDRLACEELVQDVFAELWQTRKSRSIENLGPYLKMATRYSVYKYYEKVKSLPAFEEPLEHMAVTDDADAGLFLSDLKKFIDQWLDTQPEKRREIFRMRYLDDLSTKEIAEKLDISQKTVQNTLITAMSGLKGHLGKMSVLLPVLFYLNNK